MLFFTFLPVFVNTVSSSRKTGHYTVQQSQNTHGDRHGAPTTTASSSNSTKPTGSEPLSVPKTSGGSYPRSRHSPSPKTGSSPRHSPNFRSRLLPSCQRYNSQVGGGNRDWVTPDNMHSCLWAVSWMDDFICPKIHSITSKKLWYMWRSLWSLYGFDSTQIILLC